MFCLRTVFFSLSLARHWAVVILICSPGVSATVHAQQATQEPLRPPQTQTSTDGKDTGSEKPGIFYDKDLDLSFNYPEGMRVLDMKADMESGHRNAFGASGDNDPEHQEATRCTRPVLDAELPQDNAPQRMGQPQWIWVDNSKECKDYIKPQPIFAKIVLMELDRSCLPKKLQRKEDDLLRSMALSPVALPGIQRIAKPLWYEIGTQKIHMNWGAPCPILNNKLDSPPVMINGDGYTMAQPLAGMGIHFQRCGYLQLHHEKYWAIWQLSLGSYVSRKYKAERFRNAHNNSSEVVTL